MTTTAQNKLMTETGPGTSAGALLRAYWQPAALTEEPHELLSPCARRFVAGLLSGSDGMARALEPPAAVENPFDADASVLLTIKL